MPAYENAGPFTLISGEALAADRLVKMSTTTAVYADAGEAPVGLTYDNVAITKPVAIKPLGGVLKVTGCKTITAGSKIYPAADGKVSDAAVGTQIGVLLTAITADGGKGSALLWGVVGGAALLTARTGQIEYFDDMFTYNTTFDWTVVEDVGATEADKLLDAHGGVVQAGCDGDDNDECYISSKGEFLKFQTDQRVYFEVLVKGTEAATDDANYIVGMSDTVAADLLLDNGAGPMASYDGAVFFKVDGGTVWQFETSNAGTQLTNSNVGDFTDGVATRLAFAYDYNDGVTAIVTPILNGVLGTPKNLTIAGLEEMHFFWGAKAGGAHEEALLLDSVHVICER